MVRWEGVGFIDRRVWIKISILLLPNIKIRLTQLHFFTCKMRIIKHIS